MARDGFDLVVDIGGTNVRFQYSNPDSKFATEIFKYKTKNYDSFKDLMSHFMSDHEDLPVARLAIGAAGDVVNGGVTLTNAGWPRFSEKEISENFDIPFVRLVNDFVATGWGTVRPHLVDTGFLAIDRLSGQSDSKSIVVGGGTGYGFAVVYPASSKDRGLFVDSKEVGHTSWFSPPEGMGVHVQGLDGVVKVQDILEMISALGHPSHNRNIFTGRGVGLLYDSLLAVVDGISPESVRNALARDPGTGKCIPHVPTLPEDVLKEVTNGSVIAKSTLEIYAMLLGNDIGNRLSTERARGGATVTGGMIVRMKEAVGSDFWDRFTATIRKYADGFGPGQLSSLAPIKICLEEDVSLLGLANMLRMTNPAPRLAGSVSPSFNRL